MKAMRKKKFELSEESAISILKNAEYGVLSTISDDGTPYGVPMNYVFEGDEIFLHCAKEGHKIDNMLNNPNVCFTVVGKAILIPERSTTAYESAIVFGKATIMLSDAEKVDILRKFVKRFLPASQYEAVMKKVEETISMHGVVRIDITGISGKSRE